MNEWLVNFDGTPNLDATHAPTLVHFSSIAARAQLTLWFDCIKRPKRTLISYWSLLILVLVILLNLKKRKSFETMCIIFQFLVNMRFPYSQKTSHFLDSYILKRPDNLNKFPNFIWNYLVASKSLDLFVTVSEIYELYKGISGARNNRLIFCWLFSPLWGAGACLCVT
jgi:hypothetical protein